MFGRKKKTEEEAVAEEARRVVLESQREDAAKEKEVEPRVDTAEVDLEPVPQTVEPEPVVEPEDAKASEVRERDEREAERKLFLELFGEAFEPCRAELGRLGGLFEQMVAEKNRASAAVRLYAEMYERLLALKTLCVKAIPDEGDVTPELKSIRTRSVNFERIALKNLSSFGMVPIVPERNAPFDPELHQIVAEVDVSEGGMCTPGAIASCEKIGYYQGGIVLRAAEVTVFRQESK